MTTKMQITAVHCEGYEFDLFSCCDEPGTFFYSCWCTPCMAGDIQAALHPEVGCSRAFVMTACCPVLYVGEPMDKWQAKFHLPERNFVDKFIIDLTLICFCLPCELTREWRQVANYQRWVEEGGLAEAANKKGVYEDQGGMGVPEGNTVAPNHGAPAPNPYGNAPPNQYGNAPPNQYQQQPQQPYGAPQPKRAPNQQDPYGHGTGAPTAPNQQQPYGHGTGAPTAPNPYEGQPSTQTGNYGQYGDDGGDDGGD